MPLVIEEPVSPRKFEDGIEIIAASRAALFLLIGILFGRSTDEALLQDVLRFRESFELPDPAPGAQFDPQEQRQTFVDRYGIDPFDFEQELSDAPHEFARSRRQLLTELVDSLYRKPNSETALHILFLGLSEPDERMRVAAAVSLLDILTEVSIPIRTLINLLSSFQSDLTGKIAETALHRFGTIFPARRGSSGPPTAQLGSRNAALIVHGSQFGWVGQKLGTWWQPDGEFHCYIKEKFCPTLYSKPDYFRWSGGWNDVARQMGATELLSWARNRNLSSLDILAHSHGGNLVMLATQLGLNIDHLVLMSCPVHWQQYKPDFSRVKSVISYQIHLDFIILADRGRTRFNHSNIKDQMLPRWFWSHGDTHDPDVWKQQGLSL